MATLGSQERRMNMTLTSKSPKFVLAINRFGSTLALLSRTRVKLGSLLMLTDDGYRQLICIQPVSKLLLKVCTLSRGYNTGT